MAFCSVFLVGNVFGKASRSGRSNDRVIVFDVWKYFEEAGIKDTQFRADMVYMLTSLQGIVNRERPRLYLITALSLFDLESKYQMEPNGTKRSVTDLDTLWLEYFKEKKWIRPGSIVQVSTLREVVEYFDSEVDGLVRWDVSVGATINAAFMAAGAEDLLPVSDSLAKGKLLAWFEKEFPKMKVELDLSGVFQGGTNMVSLDGIKFKSCGLAKNDVYRFAIERFMKSKKLNPSWMWYNCDASIWKTEKSWNGSLYGRELYERLGDRAHFQNNGFYNADFWISKRAIFLDLYPWDDSAPSDDPDQRVGEDFKTWNDILEWSYGLRDGKFGVVGGFIPWWIKYTKIQGDPHDPVPGEWQFIQLITSYNMANDADAAFGIANASFFQHMPTIKQEACQFTYVSPYYLQPDVRLGRMQTSGIAAYEKFTEYLHQRFGYQYTGFYITSTVDKPWLEMCARINPDGFGVNVASPPQSVGDSPVVFLKSFSVQDVVKGTFGKALEEVYARSSKGDKSNHFEPWRCILLTPTQINTVVEEMEKKYPDAKLKIVDWPNFLHLKKQWLNL